MPADSPDRIALADLDLRFRALRLPDPRRTAAVRASMTRQGQLSPLLVNARPDGTAVLIDGFKRVDVLREHGQADAPARWLRLDESGEIAAILTANRRHDGLTPLEEAWIVRRLVREQGLDQQGVGALLGRHKSWVCRRLRLSESLCPALQDDVRLGLVSATVAREVARLPRGNQAAFVHSLRKHGLSSRQTATVVTLWLASGDAETRARIEADPLAFIGPGPTNEAAPADAVEALRLSLGQLERAAARARERAGALVGQTVAAARLAPLSRPLTRAIGQVRDVLIELEAARVGWEVEADVEA